MSRFLVSLFFLSLSFWATRQLSADEAAAKTFLGQYLDAFNRQDLEATASMWAETGVHINRETGARTLGRAAIKSDLESVFKGPKKTHLAGVVGHVQVVTPDVLRVEGSTSTTEDAFEPELSQFSAILVRREGKWLISSIEESDLASPETAADALRELDWLVGDWIDDSDAPVISTFRWSANRSFLIRSFTLKAIDNQEQLGTQIIGWDPRAKSIRSWTFNADGSFGDGEWTKSSSSWMILSTQTLADGRAASGTYLLTPTNGSSLTIKLMGHEIEGEPSPASGTVTLMKMQEAAEAEKSITVPAK